MATSKRVELADRLISKTEKGELEWEETADPDAFQVAFPNYSLWVDLVETPNGSRDIVITLFNSAGNKIDEFSDVDLSTETNLQYYTKMNTMYQSARRKAVRADEAYDDILKQLGDE